MKNHFFFGYSGNKRNEVVPICDVLDKSLDSIDTIIEPFCGTSAVSFYIAMKHPKKYTYILNDNNPYLIELYKVAKDENKFSSLIESLNNKVINIDKQKYNALEPSLTRFIIHNKIKRIRAGLFPLNYKPKPELFNSLRDCPIVQFLRNENVILSCGDALTLFQTYKDSSNVLMFIDPPYINSDNTFYINPDCNIYEYLIDNNMDSMNAKLCMCLENSWIIRLLFKHNKMSKEYDKSYDNASRRKTTHIIIHNDKIKM